MIERPDHRTQLLADAIHDDWVEGPAADFSRQAAAHARRRHWLRRRLQVTGAAFCVAIATLFFHPWQSPPTHFKTKPPEQKEPAYEIISDEELLAELHDRPLLAIREENGTREFVLLDR